MDQENNAKKIVLEMIVITILITQIFKLVLHFLTSLLVILAFQSKVGAWLYWLYNP